MTNISGCTTYDNIAVKLGLKNNQFEYINQNKVDKIIIQSARDSGFKFIITDSKAIQDMYGLLSKGKEVSKKSSLDPDYYFEVWIGDEVHKYQYIVGADEKGKGNFFNDDMFFSISKHLDDTITQNLSFIRKPRDFQYVYYESILSVIKAKKDDLNNPDNKVGIDTSGDVDCLKYMFSIDLQEFNKKLNKVLPNVQLVNKNSEDFDTIIKIKNRGYNSTIFKTMITVDNKKDKAFDTYYVSAEYNFKNWDINISKPNKIPEDW